MRTAELAAVVLAVLATATATGEEADGLRSALARRGLEFGLTLQADHSSVVAGGPRRGTAFRQPLAAAVDIDTERLLGWRGGRWHLELQAHGGRNGGELVGDVHGFNNVDAEPFRQVSVLWLEQTLWGERLRLKFGKVDASEEFAAVEHGAEFLNSAAGFSPTIQGFPSYPDPAASVNAAVRPGRWLELGAGLYDGATQVGCHGRTGNRGPGTLWGAPDALFLIGEARTRFHWAGRTTRLAVGAWRHTGRFAGPGETSRTGTSGFHAVLDQELLRLHGDRSGALGLYAQVGTANGEVAAVDRHVALGLAATGLLPGRPNDIAGLMVSTVRMGATRRHERVVEAFYGVQLHPRVKLKPDLQYVADPAGDVGRDALVATLRATVTF